MKPILCLAVCLLPVACRTIRPPSQPPAVVGAQIVEHLKRGQQDAAAAAFSAAAPYEEYREKIYPLLYEAARSVTPGPEQEEMAKQLVREAIRPRLWIALVASVATTALGAKTGVLPGMRPRV